MNCLKHIGLTIICALLLTATAIAHGGKKMESKYLYEKNDVHEVISIQPQTFKIGGLFGGYNHISIFPVPQDNAVGSNSMGNAITIISFPKGKIGYDKYFRSAKDITGSGKYLPPISQDLIGFGQVRVFHLFDFKRKIHREYPIVFPVTQYIENIAIADARQRHFIFEIESQKENPKNSFDVDKSLQLVDLSGDTPKLTKEIPKVPGTTWTTTKDRVFLKRIKKEDLQVLDMNLEPAHHPLEDVVKIYREQFEFSRIHIHPHFPFAILHGKQGSVFICWDTIKQTPPHLLTKLATHFSFSPDGSWVVFKRRFGMDYKTYIMPVSEKYPHYLGSPIMISNVSFEAGQGAWTTNPTAFVGTVLDKIYRWDLDNQDFPGKDKMSFHDYIVQEDLKKLTKEKRQGLGK